MQPYMEGSNVHRKWTADEIRRLRFRAGMTQEHMAARIGVTFSAFSRWENGHSRPSRLSQMRLETVASEVEP